jgi:MFS superfamily sulfate permease-like transporter
MTCDIRLEADWLDAWVIVGGPVDAFDAARLEAAVNEALERHPRKLHAVLRSATWIDPSAVAALSRCRERAQERGARLVVHRSARPIRSLLHVGPPDQFEVELDNRFVG